MKKALRETTLPDGTRVFCVHSYEVTLLNQEKESYFQNGISVSDGDIIFDVGANIGMFGLWVRQLGRSQVKLYSFEPMPRAFLALQANAQRFDPANWKVFSCALGKEKGTARFGYHKRMTVLSSPFPDDSQDMKDFLRETLLRNLKSYPPPLRWLRWLPGFLQRPLVNFGLSKVLRYKTVDCPVRTLSQVMREEDVPRIDLLKIDVERGEMDVLAGVEPADWQKIRQVVMEIHDLRDQRVAQARDLLQRHGFTALATEQEPMFRGTDVFNLFATRRAA